MKQTYFLFVSAGRRVGWRAVLTFPSLELCLWMLPGHSGILNTGFDTLQLDQHLRNRNAKAIKSEELLFLSMRSN